MKKYTEYIRTHTKKVLKVYLWKIVRKEIELKLGGRFTAERFLNQTSLEPTSARVQR